MATGADPVHLSLPGASTSKVHYLRSFADSKLIAEKASTANRVVVIGAGFIGLEVAASLRSRNIDVHVVAPGDEPLEKVFGGVVGASIRELHESHGVIFHLGQTVDSADDAGVTLSDGTSIAADFVVIGAGVKPSVKLAELAGLRVDNGVLVNQYLETSIPGVFAAGDIARWPDSHTGHSIRVEHWAVAERQGQTAAKNMLGQREPFDAVPFFWSQHYDVTINFIGHAGAWDNIRVEGSLADRDCSIEFRLAGKIVAVATIGRDVASLEVERSQEERDA